MQWKRLIFSKKDIDTPPGYKWVFSPWKFSALLIFIASLLFLLYALLRPDTAQFLREFLTWVMIALVVGAVAVLMYGFIRGAKTKIKGYAIALVFIVLVYVIMGWIFKFAFDWDFNYGYGAWILMITLAGFHKIDEKLDFRDVMYAFFVIGAIVGGNIPFGTGGTSALDRLTWVINKLIDLINNFDINQLSQNITMP